MSCVSVSSPVVAVTGGGAASVRSGSIMARRANISGLRILAFTLCAGKPSTALRVTSAPVPAVVGMAMNGNGGFSKGRAWPITSR